MIVFVFLGLLFEPISAFVAPSAAIHSHTPQLGRLQRQPVAAIVDDAAALFANVRIPAALVAGASLPLGFAFPFPSKSDRPAIRCMKAVNSALGFLAVQSELLCVLVSTNAINRLAGGGLSFVAADGANTVLDLFRMDSSLLQHWLGTYIHFVFGVFCIVVMGGIRGWLAVGPRLGTPLVVLTMAIFSRFLAATNRGIICQEFGGGDFLRLIVIFTRTFVANTIARKRWLDMASLTLLVASAIMLCRRSSDLFGEMADVDGDGVVTPSERRSLARRLQQDLTDSFDD